MIGKPWRLAIACVALAASAAVIWANWLKTAWTGIQGWGRPYWWLDYRHGFVRRGLAGEVFQFVFGRLDEAHLMAPVDLIHRLCCAGIAAALLWLLARAILACRSAQRLAFVIALGLWCAASELWPTLAYTQGYLDSLVLLWAMAAALCLRTGWTVAAGLLLFAGPFIHEYFVFLVPFVLAADPSLGRAPAPQGRMSELDDIDTSAEPVVPRRLLILAAVAAVAAAIVTFGASAAATRLEISAMPLLPVDREMLTTTTLSQTLGQSFSASASQLFERPLFTVRNFAFFLLPGLLCVTGMLVWSGRRPAPGLWLRAGAALFPVSALLLAWDLSRLLVMATLTAGALFLMTVRDAPETPAAAQSPQRTGVMIGLATLLGLAALAYAAAPMAYVYYEPGPVTLFPLKVWPGDGYATFGVEHLWSNARNAGAAPSLQAVGR